MVLFVANQAADTGTTVQSPPALPGPYAHLHPPSGDLLLHPSLPRVPSLASICIHLLFPYPTQLSSLSPLRLHHRPGQRLLHSLIPSLPQSSPQELDPRLWATLVQLYDSLPDSFHSHPTSLQDIHLPLLQSIPSTPSFSLITTLELPACPELTDDSIANLKFMHALAAFDASHTCLTNHAIRTLKSTLHLTHSPPPALPYRGPCPLRMLRLRNCKGITNDVLQHLRAFHLLSVVDLRGTKCRPSSADFHPFQSSEIDSLYHPASLSDALTALATISSTLFSSQNTYTLRIERLYHPHPFHRPKQVKSGVLHENSVVVLSPSVGSSKSLNHLTKREPLLLNGTSENKSPEQSSETDDAEAAARVQAAKFFYQKDHKLRRPPDTSYLSPPADGPQFSYEAYFHRHRESTPESKKDHLLRLYRDPPPWTDLETRMNETERAHASAREQAALKRAGANLADIQRTGEQAHSKRQQMELLEREVKRRRVSADGLNKATPTFGAPDSQPTASKNPFRRRLSAPADPTEDRGNCAASSSTTAKAPSKPLIPISRVKIPQLSAVQRLEKNVDNKVSGKKRSIKKTAGETDQCSDRSDKTSETQRSLSKSDSQSKAAGQGAKKGFDWTAWSGRGK